MTETNREIIDGIDLTPGAHQDPRGVDLTLIRHALSLTSAERLAENVPLRPVSSGLGSADENPLISWVAVELR